MTFRLLVNSLLLVAGTTSVFSQARAGTAGPEEGAPAVEDGGAGEPEAFLRGNFHCVARNRRGAEYFGDAWGRRARRRACEYALEACRRDSRLPGSCHVIHWNRR